jgi:hypothetical protein
MNAVIRALETGETRGFYSESSISADSFLLWR